MPSPIRRIPRTATRASLPARELAARLDQLAVDELVTYDELSILCGYDVQERRDLLYTAWHILREQKRKLFGVTAGVGIYLASEGGKLDITDRELASMHRKSGRTIQKLQTVELGALTPLQKQQCLAQMAQSAYVHMGTSEQTRHQLATASSPQPLVINPADYQGLFKGM